jgi:hypothetical protein
LYRKFLNARSPMRLLEKGLHGGLGPGNLGVVIAGPGVGKTSFLVGVAMDELLRSGHVLHASMTHSVTRVRDHYDTVFEELATTRHLEEEAFVHVDVDRCRSIRAYPGGELITSKIRDAVKVESDATASPSLVVIEGFDFEATPRQEFVELKALANEIAAEIWLSATSSQERISEIPASVERIEDIVSVILALEPGDDAVLLRALKDHDNPDLSELHVALDPRTMLLIRH